MPAANRFDEARAVRALHQNPAVAAEIERAFRRGFHHAAFFAAEAAREGFDADDFARWESAVRRWRSDQKGREVMPPVEPWEV